jgi:hypothetical protein
MQRPFTSVMTSFARSLCVVGCWSVVATMLPAQPAVIGRVIHDRNGNGRADPGEPGVANVVASNQVDVVRTDATGAFRFDAAPTGLVYITVPDDRRATSRFWQPVAPSAAPLVFLLAPAPRARTFTFVHGSDPHVADASLPRLQRARELIDSIAPAFALLTGDLVRDALRVTEQEARGYYDLFAREAERFRTPLFTVPGNHELFGLERLASGVPAEHPLHNRGMYRRYRGPDYYSFDVGGLHVIALNTIDVYDDTWYHGQVDSVQLAWLARDLAMVPANRPVVTFNHIPLYSAMESIGGFTERPPAPSVIPLGSRKVYRHTVANASAVLAILRTRRLVLALGGHIHARERLQYDLDGRAVRFEQAAAIVGPSDAGGMDFRSGLTVYRVRDGVIDAGRFLPLDPPRTTPSAPR